MLRKSDYKATSYSPLNQITTQNVNDLRLVWSWAMMKAASNGGQPALWFTRACCTATRWCCCKRWMRKPVN